MRDGSDGREEVGGDGERRHSKGQRGWEKRLILGHYSPMRRCLIDRLGVRPCDRLASCPRDVFVHQAASRYRNTLLGMGKGISSQLHN